ncbi:hypothetical protein NDU88_001024 [Pleurodeles waltl]|uniref:Uncharacterized protein n=1 Tax=Pleurodeles waltl TaxID=8319 RepID=A0AAV7KPA3_PLEWA|nr:hypothetical protein NDU88_001024 [Pleurodeles waltl]
MLIRTLVKHTWEIAPDWVLAHQSESRSRYRTQACHSSLSRRCPGLLSALLTVRVCVASLTQAPYLLTRHVSVQAPALSAEQGQPWLESRLRLCSFVPKAPAKQAGKTLPGQVLEMPDFYDAVL